MRYHSSWPAWLLWCMEAEHVRERPVVAGHSRETFWQTISRRDLIELTWISRATGSSLVSTSVAIVRPRRSSRFMNLKSMYLEAVDMEGGRFSIALDGSNPVGGLTASRPISSGSEEAL